MTSTFVLGVDLDGVVGDYESAFRTCAAELLGRDPATMGPQVTWDYAGCGWGISDRDHFLELHTRAVAELGMFRTMDMVEGAAEALWALSDAGVWIRIITHRLNLKGAHAVSVSDTVTWLDDHSVPYRDICFIADKPQVGAALYIDDAPGNVTALRAAGAEAAVFDQAYNRDVDGLRVRSWADVVALVSERSGIDVAAGANPEHSVAAGHPAPWWR